MVHSVLVRKKRYIYHENNTNYGKKNLMEKMTRKELHALYDFLTLECVAQIEM